MEWRAEVEEREFRVGERQVTIDNEDRMKTPPNLFDFATSELSQDAFICWLASWSDPAFKTESEPLHATATAFLDRLLEVGKGPKILEYRSIQVRRQWKDIDVLLVVNNDTAIIIEDKTDTKDHSGQLEKYRKAVASEFQESRIAAVYLKTGDQGNYLGVNQAGYGRFLRRDFLDILNRGEQARVTSDIFSDFLRHLRRIEAAVQSFSTVPLDEWNKDWNRWKGFFLVLQDRLGGGDWNFVPNPSGGFMGFSWHWKDDKFLQLENDKLCFKVMVPDKAQQTAKWWEWHNALIAVKDFGGVKIEKSVRRKGQWMTVAVLDGDYRQGTDGRLDLDRTVETLRKVEALMDAALLRVANAPPSAPPSSQ